MRDLDKPFSLISHQQKQVLDFALNINELKLVIEVLDFELEEAISELFTLKLNIAINKNHVYFQADNRLDLNAQLGKETAFSVNANNKILRTICGIIASIKYVNASPNKIYYALTIKPKLWLLGLNQNSRIYHYKSVPEILQEILAQHHINAKAFFLDEQQEQNIEPKTKHQVREYVTQKRESDYEFFARLAAEEGIIFWFEEDCLFYSDAQIGVEPGPSLIYNPHPQSGTKEFVIDKLEFGAQITPNKVVLKDYKYTHPKTLISAEVTSNNLDFASVIHESYGRFVNTQENKEINQIGQHFAQNRLEALTNDALQGTASSNCIQIMPGKLFELTKHPFAELNGIWQAIRVKHYGAMPQLRSNYDEQNSKHKTTLVNEFSFISGYKNFKSPFKYKPLADGNELATVVGPKDEEIWVNEYGAVKVRFHWQQNEGGESEQATTWLRVAQAASGDKFGFVAIPRIGQEVIVSYLNGDIDRPIIIGTLYNEVNKPPYDLPKYKTQTVIKTKTHKGDGFNELQFEDEKGQEQIYLHAQKDMALQIRNNKMEQIGGDLLQQINQNEIKLVKQDKNLTVTGSLKQQVERYVGLNAGSDLVLQSAKKITLKVGASFIAIDNSAIYLNAPNIKFNSGGSAAQFLSPLQLDGAINSASQQNTAGEAVGNSGMTENRIANLVAQSDTKITEIEEICCDKKLIYLANKHLEAMQNGAEKDQLTKAITDFTRNNIALKKAYLAASVYEDDEEASPIGWENISNNESVLQDLTGLNSSDLVIEKTRFVDYFTFWKKSEPVKSDFRVRVYNSIISKLVCDKCKLDCGAEDTFKPVVVFKGTSSGEDWLNNITQALTSLSTYYSRAKKIGDNIKKAGKKVEFAGHSLGGGLASKAVQNSGMPATTFNAAGLRHNIFGQNDFKKLIQAYRVKGEFLTEAQENGWGSFLTAASSAVILDGLEHKHHKYSKHAKDIKHLRNIAVGKTALSLLSPDAVGTIYELENDLDISAWDFIAPVISRKIKLHGIQEIIKALNKQIKKDEELIMNKIKEVKR